eukprot:gb/GFBE01021776.1/.p1 GENE.gb/GFBE01021776.1/~~gb/GFBE01021776.1/.p1  ORF type:complete len:256 (+),score=57.35 gb/GFBE01021776.1/:1-768(+)
MSSPRELQLQQQEEGAAGVQVEIASDSMAADSADDDGREQLGLQQGKQRKFCNCYPQSQRGRRLCAFGVACSTAVFITVVVATAFLWPRKPSWELKSLDVDKDALNGLIGVFLGHSPSNGSIPSVPFAAVVELYNPNFASALAEPGVFAIKFHGVKMGTGTSGTLHVPARSSIQIPVNVSVDLDDDVVKDLNKAISGNMFDLPFTTVGTTDVKVPFGIRVRCSVECAIEAAVLQLISDPAKVVKQKDCTYRYSLW